MSERRPSPRPSMSPPADVMHLILQFIADTSTAFALLSALPRALCSPPMQSLAELARRVPRRRLWPILDLPAIATESTEHVQRAWQLVGKLRVPDAATSIDVLERCLASSSGLVSWALLDRVPARILSLVSFTRLCEITVGDIGQRQLDRVGQLMLASRTLRRVRIVWHGGPATLLGWLHIVLACERITHLEIEGDEHEWHLRQRQPAHVKRLPPASVMSLGAIFAHHPIAFFKLVRLEFASEILYNDWFAATDACRSLAVLEADHCERFVDQVLAHCPRYICILRSTRSSHGGQFHRHPASFASAASARGGAHKCLAHLQIARIETLSMFFKATLQQYAHLAHLNLSQTNLHAYGLHDILEALQQTPITALHLADNHLGDDGAGLLARALPHWSSLRELNLSNNAIGDDGMLLLASVLPHCWYLQKLYLLCNRLQIAGVLAWAACVRQGLPSLEWLDLSYAGMTLDHVGRLLHAKQASPLLAVDINVYNDAWTAYDVEGIVAVAAAQGICTLLVHDVDLPPVGAAFQSQHDDDDLSEFAPETFFHQLLLR
ncbi:hypothetical protein SPRG_13175 [Saprolegnia parasitica CBS 223.65]|uniref:F-box domain-containing protein n=1 Tax=Saprolegnia parasitica (strain CBS 223.65) TaxID=695850 RepID=A0A067C5E9_SAPPC|nr:hypothetical protein SPRG_13175 [Saprolegnia parasitica CBS 223.65]KDO21761.1 hypothetical protein SPRG_13175 [Saprolegnia parasitica CBS 223.65]|eukprot:XP_012207561.1 hypothetical protein SPRG_13175 [Saprolegnia parasitica CBS 223.65]